MRTVQQGRVYGKRKTNAPRAVLENGSPLKTTSSENLSLNEVIEEDTSENIVKQLEAQIASITLKDENPTKVEVDTNDLRSPAKSPAHIQYQTSVGTPASSKRINTPKRLLSTPTNPVQATKSPVKIYSSQKRLSFTPRQPRAKPVRKTKPIIRLSSGCVEDEKINEYVQRILDEATSQLAARGVQKFSSWAARSETAFDPVKIAEGSYGEVYKLRLKEDICTRNMSKSRLAKLREYGEGVFKVVPLRAQKGLGSKKFTTIDEIVAEVKLLKLLDPIPGFARFREVHVVQGRFPPSFQAAWDSYKAAGKDCQNPNPANKRAYSDQQLWAILEMDDAGVELEQFKWSSVFQVYDIFWGVAMGLARAEEYALFEHRDLHLGNVCLRSTRPDGDMQLLADVNANQLEASSGFGVSSLETTIIDYSLSRAELRLTDDPEEKVDIASTDLDSKGIFAAVGRDEDEILQRNTYRLYVKVVPNGITRGV
jgi:serine/threonine-protein kinase haspin